MRLLTVSPSGEALMSNTNTHDVFLYNDGTIKQLGSLEQNGSFIFASYRHGCFIINQLEGIPMFSDSGQEHTYIVMDGELYKCPTLDAGVKAQLVYNGQRVCLSPDRKEFRFYGVKSDELIDAIHLNTKLSPIHNLMVHEHTIAFYNEGSHTLMGIDIANHKIAWETPLSREVDFSHALGAIALGAERVVSIGHFFQNPEKSVKFQGAPFMSMGQMASVYGSLCMETGTFQPYLEPTLQLGSKHPYTYDVSNNKIRALTVGNDIKYSEFDLNRREITAGKSIDQQACWPIYLAGRFSHSYHFGDRGLVISSRDQRWATVNYNTLHVIDHGEMDSSLGDSYHPKLVNDTIYIPCGSTTTVSVYKNAITQ